MMSDTGKRVRINISVTPDTAERLRQYAFENHKSTSQAVTDMVWAAKVKYKEIRGQMSLKVD